MLLQPRIICHITTIVIVVVVIVIVTVIVIVIAIVIVIVTIVIVIIIIIITIVIITIIIIIIIMKYAKKAWLSTLLFWGEIDLDLQGKNKLKSQNFIMSGLSIMENIQPPE